MQRVVRDTTTTFSNDNDAIVDLIRKHFPPTVASLYAMPRQGTQGAVEWWSELGGQPQRYHDLSKDQQVALLKRYHQRQQAVAHLADELEQRSAPGDAIALRSLLAPPDLDHLYEINGDPVVTCWRKDSRPATTLPPPPAAPLATERARSSRTIWKWLLPLWLLALLIGLFAFYWWFFRPALDVPVVDPINEPMACIEQPAEFVVIFDTSGSMALNIDVSPEDEDWAFSMTLAQRASMSREQKMRLVQLHRSPQRGDIAKSALVDMIQRLPDSTNMGLITFAGCKAPPINQGVFTIAQRPGLINAINELNMDDGTPLASSLEMAAYMVDGKNRDAIVLVFVDGEDGCKRNQCAVATEIAKAKPRLKFNVVDITGRGLSNCIAENTGGRVYSTRDAGEIRSMLKLATTEVADKNYCSK